MELQKTLNSQSNLEKEEQSQRQYTADFKLYYKVTVIKIVQYWHEKQTHRSMEKIESPEMNPCTCSQLIYDKGVKNIQWGKESPSN